MAGYNESGTGRKQLDNKAARAYCEGQVARSESNSTLNPYEGSQNKAEEIAYGQGWAHISALAGEQLTRDDIQSCAVPLVVVPAAP